MSATSAGTAPARLVDVPEPARTALWGLAYAVALAVGLGSHVRGTSLGMLWPAAGIATLWLLSAGPRTRLRVLLAVAVLTTVANAVTVGSPGTELEFAL